MRLVAEPRTNVKVKVRLTTADKKKLKKRHTIENLFCRLKQFKRVRNRMDTHAPVFVAHLHAAFIIMLLSQIQVLPV